MKDEIKKILDRLERIDHKEYTCGFEFADSGSFDEVGRCFEERKKLANYITDLQEKKEIPEKLLFESGKISDNEFLAKYITHNRNKINEIIDYLDYFKSKGE